VSPFAWTFIFESLSLSFFLPSTVSQSCPHVLPWCPGCYCHIRHHSPRKSSKQVAAVELELIISLFVCHLQETLARAKSWVKELQRQANPNIVIALVGNKLDLDSKRAVTAEV